MIDLTGVHPASACLSARGLRGLFTLGAMIAAFGLIPQLLFAQAPATRPNIIFILSDDLGYGELSSHGQTRYETPHLDRLAAEGVRFTNHYAGAAICAPSRAALMTGRHTGHTQVRNNFGTLEGRTGQRIPLSADETTVGEMLQRAGYRTALIGKWGLGEEGSGHEPWKRGFDFFYGFINQAHAHNHYPEFLYRNEAKEPLIPNYSNEERVYANDRFTEEALTFIEAQRERPFYLQLSYTTPHGDLKCPADSVAEVKARYPHLAVEGLDPKIPIFAAMVTRLDRDVGRIMSRLKDLGLDERTLVIFTSDNGAHDEDGKNNEYFNASGDLRGIKRDLYEGGIRVPFLARWPGRIQPGRTSDHISAFWDFLPTAAELAGARLPDSAIDGISYRRTLFGEPGQETHAHLYWESLIGREGRQAMRAGEWKLLRNGQEAPWELYRLTDDIGEARNLANDHPDLVNRLAAQLASARTESPHFPLRLPPGIRSSGN